MSNQSFFKNKLAVGVMTLGLATTASLLAPNSAEAVNLKFNVNGTYAQVELLLVVFSMMVLIILIGI